MGKVITLCIAGFLIAYYAFTSGAVFELTKSEATERLDVPYSIALSNERTRIIGVYGNNDDTDCARWLVEESDLSLSIYTDYCGVSIIMDLSDGNRPTYYESVESYYLFLTSWSTEHNKMVFGRFEGLREYEPLPDLSNAKEAFRRGNAVVYVIRDKVAPLVYYNGSGLGTGSDYHIGLASRDDYDTHSGFTKYIGNPILSPSVGEWDSTMVKDPCVVSIGDQFVMYYAGHGTAPGYFIGIATSPDGYTWTKYDSNPVIDQGGAGTWDFGSVVWPRVYDTEVVGAKRYRMLYTGWNDVYLCQLGCAYSADGFSWTKYGDNPVMTVGTGGDWDSSGASGGSNAVLLDGTYYMLYTGISSGHYSIGLVTFTDFEGTYTKSDFNPVLTRHLSAYQVLTTELTIGTKVVTVTDTSAFHEDEPVWIDLRGGAKEFNRVDTIDSSTQITLVNDATTTYPVGTTLRSWMAGSICASALYHSNGMWTNSFTAFMVISDGVCAETTGLATSSDLVNWTIDYADSPPLPFVYNDGTWDDTSAENLYYRIINRVD